MIINVFHEINQLRRLLENSFNLDNLFEKSKEPHYIYAREIFDYIAVNHLKWTVANVCKISGRSHSSVVKSKNKVSNLIRLKKYRYTEQVENLKTEINNIINENQ